MGWLLSACGSTAPVPVTYAKKVSVHSVLPVHVRVTNTFQPNDEPVPQWTRFDSEYQDHFAESLRAELVRHGVFGSVSDMRSDDIFRIDVHFARMASFVDSRRYKLTVFVETEYNGERDANIYHLLFMDEDEATAESQVADRNRQAAEQLMSLIMDDIQKTVIDREVSLKAHVKERRTDQLRMLVKW
jgi:hypothetical protein